MSSELEKNLVDLSHSLVRVCPEKAVFTASQTEEILRLDVAMNRIAIAEIEKLKCIKYDNLKYAELESEINKLIEYDEHNSEIVSCLRREVKNLEEELNSVEHKVHELSERTGVAMLSQAHELQQLECVVKKLAIKEYKDERIEDIVRRLVIVENREMKDCRVEKILECLKLYETKETVQQLIKRLALHEAKEVRDARVDAVLAELCQLKKVNEKQNQHISELTSQNLHQSEEIRCLTEKLNRNTLALDNKIDTLERREAVDNKVDFDQNAAIKFLQSEIARLHHEMDNFQKAMLLK